MSKPLKNKAVTNFSINPKDHDITLTTWDEIFEFQAKKDGANYNMLKDWLKEFYDVPIIK